MATPHTLCMQYVPQFACLCAFLLRTMLEYCFEHRAILCRCVAVYCGSRRITVGVHRHNPVIGVCSLASEYTEHDTDIDTVQPLDSGIACHKHLILPDLCRNKLNNFVSGNAEDEPVMSARPCYLNGCAVVSSPTHFEYELQQQLCVVCGLLGIRCPFPHSACMFAYCVLYITRLYVLHDSRRW